MMVIKISNDTLSIGSGTDSNSVEICENNCGFAYKGVLNLIINVEKLDGKIYNNQKHCDSILINDKYIFFIELKYTKNTKKGGEISEIMKSMYNKYDGTKKAFEKIKKLLNKNCYENKNICYVLYIYEDTYNIIDQMKHLIKKQKNRFIGLASKEKCLEQVLIKKCGTDLYKSGDYISIIH